MMPEPQKMLKDIFSIGPFFLIILSDFCTNSYYKSDEK